MPGLILAAVTPDNTPHGYNLTFAFPMLLFIVVGAILYLLFSRPHARIPVRGESHLEPAGPAAAAGPAAGSVSGRDGSTDAVRQQDRDAPAADGTEASE